MIVAHRLSSIAHADRILVLKAGLIIEEGSHRTLLAAGGAYRTMWDLQHSPAALAAAQEAPAAA